MVIYVDTVWIRIDDLALCAEQRKQHRSRCRSRAVAAVNRDAQAIGAPLYGAYQMVCIISCGVFDPNDPANLPAFLDRRQLLFIQNDSFDLILKRVGELVALAVEYLDAVILDRIVRRRDHNASVAVVFFY